MVESCEGVVSDIKNVSEEVKDLVCTDTYRYNTMLISIDTPLQLGGSGGSVQILILTAEVRWYCNSICLRRKGRASWTDMSRTNGAGVDSERTIVPAQGVHTQSAIVPWWAPPARVRCDPSSYTYLLVHTYPPHCYLHFYQLSVIPYHIGSI